MNRIEFLANLDKYKGEDHSTFLEHYGILGQKWGRRRWQNPDGTFNEEGKIRYFGSQKAMEDQKVGGFFDTSADIAVRNAIEETRQAREKGIGSLLYQNLDGTLTKKGKKLLNKYRNGNEKAANKINDLINMDLYEKTVPEPIVVSKVIGQDDLNKFMNTNNDSKFFENKEKAFRTILNDKDMAIAKEHRDEISDYIKRYIVSLYGAPNGETPQDIYNEINSIEDKKLRHVINAATAYGFIESTKLDSGEQYTLRFEGKFGSQPGSNKAKEETDTDLFTKKNEKGRSETADKMEDAAKKFREDGDEKLADETEKTAKEMREATTMSTPERKNMTKAEKRELKNATNRAWKAATKGNWVDWLLFGIIGGAIATTISWFDIKSTAKELGIEGKSKTWSASDWDKIAYVLENGKYAFDQINQK